MVSMSTDMVWSNAAYMTFLSGKLWFIFTLMVFVASQSVLNHLGQEPAAHRRLAGGGDEEEDEVVRIAIFCCRVFIYIFSMGQWVIYHARNSFREYRAHDTMILVGRVKVPTYLSDWQNVASLMLTVSLLLMLALEPILRCFGGDNALFTESCDEGQAIVYAYSIVSTVGMILYYLLLVDLAVFSTRLSAFALVVTRVISEVALFLFGLIFFACAFAAAVSSLEQSDHDFSGIHQSGLSLIKITLGMFAGSRYDLMNESANIPRVILTRERPD